MLAIIKKTVKKSFLFPTMSVVMNIYRRFQMGYRNDKAVILAYHRIANVSEDPSQLCVSIEKFSKHMEYAKKKFKIIKLSDLVYAIKNKENLKNTLVVTFDDGYFDNLENALPILKQFQIPATVFVTAGKIGDNTAFSWDLNVDKKDQGRALTENELKKMSQSPFIEIGAHTKSHPILSKLTKERQESEILDSKTFLQKITGKKIDLFAYPFGTKKDFNQESKDLLEKRGFLCGCSCEGGYVGHNSDIYDLPRNIVRNWNIFMLRFFSL